MSNVTHSWNKKCIFFQHFTFLLLKNCKSSIIRPCLVCLHVFRHFSLECPALLILRFSSRISVFRSVHLELNHNSTLPTQFVDGMQRCFLEPGAWWIYQNVSHANISLAGVSGVKKRCQTLGTRTKKIDFPMHWSSCTWIEILLASYHTVPSLHFMSMLRDLQLFRHKLTLCFFE